MVAEEVGRLADDVRSFAEQISSISEEIMRGAREVAEEFRKNVGATQEVRAVVQRAALAFEGILADIRTTAERAGEISELSETQRAAAQHVTR